MNMRQKIANLFGKHSRKIWRSVIGALWSLPMRYITFPLQFTTALALISAGYSWFVAMSGGVVIGLIARLLDNLAVEFVVFETIKNWFLVNKKMKGPYGGN